MSAETVAYAALNAASAVTGLVSTRIYPDFVPQEKDLPAVAINRAATEFINTIHGSAPLGSIATLEVWCMASTRSAAEAVADAVVATLAAAGFSITNRAPEFDADSQVFAAVVSAVSLD